MRKKHYIFLLIFGILTSCLKDEYIIIDQDNTPPVVVSYVNSSLHGIVYGKKGIPLSGVEVRLGVNYQQTNQNGLYCFSNIPIAQEGEVVRFNKIGHVESYAFVKPVLNDLMTLSSSMVTPDATHRFANSDEISMPIGLDGKIEIAANAFLNEDGSDHQDDIIIEVIFYENICNANCYPVNLDINTSDQLRLKTDMIIGLNILSSSGGKLSLKDEYSVLVAFPSNRILTDELDLYEFDKSTLRWSENSSAIIKSQNNYILNEIPDFIAVGETKEYSWISGEIIDGYGAQHFKSYGIATSGSDGAVFDHAKSTSSGRMQIAWPINEPFKLWINNECGKALPELHFPATTKKRLDLGEINLGLNTGSSVIRGTIYNQYKIPVKNGMVKIIPKYGRPYYSNIDSTNGHYFTQLRGCGLSDYDFIVYDFDEMNFHQTTANVRSNGRGKYNCHTTQIMSNYLLVKFDDNNYLLDAPNLMLEGNKISFSYQPNLTNFQEAFVSLEMPSSKIANSSNGNFTFLSFDQNRCEIFFNSKTNGNAVFKITSVPVDSINNSFVGEVNINDYLDAAGVMHKVNIKFDISL